MDNVIEIDLKFLIKHDLNINEYLTLLKLSENIKGNDIPFYTTDSCLSKLDENNYIELADDNIYMLPKGSKLFTKEIINFDDIFDLYPYKTPDGRVLRAKNKELGGKLTRDYKVLKDKYLAKIKNIDTHNQVIKCMNNMINHYKNNGKMNFMNGLEVVINQNAWERYVDDEPSSNSFSMEKI